MASIEANRFSALRRIVKPLQAIVDHLFTRRFQPEYKPEKHYMRGPGPKSAIRQSKADQLK